MGKAAHKEADEETENNVLPRISKSGSCGKSGCGEEDNNEKDKCTGDFWLDGF